MIIDYVDSKFGIEYLNDFDFVVALGISSENIYSDICINPLLDATTKRYMRYEAGTEEGISALFLHDFCQSLELKNYIDALDYGYLTSETNISEEEMQELKDCFDLHKKPLLLIGSNFYMHTKSRNILSMFSYLAESLNIAFLSMNENEIFTIKNRISNLEAISELPENNGCMVYVDSKLYKRSVLRFSSEFAKAWRIKNGDVIDIAFDGFNIKTDAILDTKLCGVIGILGLDMDIDCGYRYKQVVINK